MVNTTEDGGPEYMEYSQYSAYDANNCSSRAELGLDCLHFKDIDYMYEDGNELYYGLKNGITLVLGEWKKWGCFLQLPTLIFFGVQFCRQKSDFRSAFYVIFFLQALVDFIEYIPMGLISVLYYPLYSLPIRTWNAIQRELIAIYRIFDDHCMRFAEAGQTLTAINRWTAVALGFRHNKVGKLGLCVAFEKRSEAFS
ncbi:hypothetical protein AAVH_15692 [Aphelenchoides avenae]|nr:hypothetical protein AAVH_15692 [Aphelenchus avenae]